MDPPMYYETGNYIDNRLPNQFVQYQQLNTHTNSSDYNNGEPLPAYQQTQLHNVDLQPQMFCPNVYQNMQYP